MKRYTIQEFADRSGVSIDRLRHYEKLNLMRPGRNERNGYRYYSDEHLLDVYRICFMQSLGVPLKDVLKEIEAGKAERRIAQRIDEIEKELTLLHLQLERLMSIRSELEYEKEMWGISCRRQKHYVLYYDRIEKNAKGKNIIAQWMHYTPLMYPVFETHINELDEHLQPGIGLAIEARYANEAGIDGSVPGVEMIESILLPCRIQLTNFLNPQKAEFAPILEYCRENDIDIEKRLLYRITAEKCRNEGYVAQVYMPVQPQ